MKRRFLRREQGAATVEFAIVAILLLTFVFGIIEFGVLLFDKHILTNASREGARAGVIMWRDADQQRVYNSAIIDKVNDYAKEHMVSFGASSALNTTVSPSQAIRAAAPFGTELVVRVEYDYEFLFLSIVGMGKIDLKAETRMRME